MKRYIDKFTETPFSITAQKRLTELILFQITDPDERLQTGNTLYRRLSSSLVKELSSYGTYALVRSAFQHEELSDSLLSVIADMESLDMTGLSPELQEEIRYFRVTSRLL